MQAAIIPADVAQPIRFEEIDPVTALASLVGGDIELVGLRAYAMNLYINELGKHEGLSKNPRATVLCHWAEAISADDYIVGDAVVLGPIDSDKGEDTGLADVQQEWLAALDAQLGSKGQESSH